MNNSYECGSSFLIFSKAEDFYRFDLLAEHDPWLESGNGPALRTHPAGLIGDRDILRQQIRRVASFGGRC
jgi:hypothetical protein